MRRERDIIYISIYNQVTWVRGIRYVRQHPKEDRAFLDPGSLFSMAPILIASTKSSKIGFWALQALPKWSK